MLGICIGEIVWRRDFRSSKFSFGKFGAGELFMRRDAVGELSAYHHVSYSQFNKIWKKERKKRQGRIYKYLSSFFLPFFSSLALESEKNLSETKNRISPVATKKSRFTLKNNNKKRPEITMVALAFHADLFAYDIRHTVSHRTFSVYFRQFFFFSYSSLNNKSINFSFQSIY